MLDGLIAYFAERTLGGFARDALDIAIVYYACYRALLVTRGTRAVQIGVGLAMLLAVYAVARVLDLVTVLTVMGALLSSLLLIIVVVFQNDIRRGLQRIGSQAIFYRLTRGPETRVIDEVVEAATELARHRIGALITFEQEANLDEFVGAHKGHTIDAAVSRELLVSLFIPEGVNKLHDGAVIIRHLRIAKAGVFFPMPEQRVVDISFGSRHRAALGITEETDAVVVIVSEERGTISFCFNGNIASNLDGPKLRTLLEAVFSPKAAQKKRANARRANSIVTQSPVENTAPATDTAAVLATGDEAAAAANRLRTGPDLVRTVPDLPKVAEPRISEEKESAEVDRRQPLRRGPESDPPPPLRSRMGLDETAPVPVRIPRAAGVPSPVRKVLSAREAGALRTPVASSSATDTKDPRGTDRKSGDITDSGEEPQ